jgi:predicted metal-dependent enzyme (double-stranded beta helix superfamily)
MGMADTLEKFARNCNEILKNDPGPGGRERIRRALETVLKDPSFVSKHLGPDNTEPRKILYEDPEFKFCIVAHVHEGPKDSKPHDHGPSWAIYGQAKGKTTMTEWKVVRPRTGGKPAVVEPEKVYDLDPGMAALYDIGHVHSPSRNGATRLIRIEGENLDLVRRDAYVAAEMAR